MRKILYALIVPLGFIACKDSSTGNAAATPAAGNDSAATATITMPYVAQYSSNYVPGKQVDVQTVLNSYKAWETGDMKALRATFGDSIMMGFPDGGSISGPSDSVVRVAGKVRDSLSKVELTFYAWLSNHSVDKNTEWVNVWYREVDYYKSGKVDSTAYEDDNMLMNGKIIYTDSHSRKLKKK
jgi:hypothetical protein